MKDRIIYLNKYDSRLQLEGLLEEVKNIRINPDDAYEITAILESIGWNDTTAAEQFGVSDVFELAELVFQMFHETVSFQHFEEKRKESKPEKYYKILKSFLRGVIFALPMVISVFAMLTIKLSLWSYVNLSVELATSIAIGTILSFMTIGGFTQIIARRGFFYIEQYFYNVAKRVTYYFVQLGIICCLIVCLIFTLINTYFHNFTLSMFIIAVLYFVFLCVIWLSVTVMYLLRKEITFTSILTLGIILVFVFFHLFNLDIITSQIIALLIVSLISWVIVVRYFNKAEGKLEKGISIPMPRKSILFYTLKPYFIYGFLYFTFLYMDRIVSWSSNSFYMPYVFWFRGQYELGLDFAILILIIPMGVCEVIVTELMEKLNRMQKNDGKGKNISKICISYYHKSLVTITFSAILSSLFISLAIYIIYRFQLLDISIFVNSVSIFVYIIAIISYSLLVISLANAVTLFSLSQPEMITKALLISLLVNFLVGFVLSRWLGYSWGIMGLLAGTIVLAILSTRNIMRVMKKVDYYIYAAV